MLSVLAVRHPSRAVMPVLLCLCESVRPLVVAALRFYSQLPDIARAEPDISAAVQIDKIVGRSAPTEFVAAVEQIAEAHHTSLAVDVIR